MKEAFLEYIKRGKTMTAEEVAEILRVKVSLIKKKARTGELPKVPGFKPVRFDPEAVLAVVCPTIRAFEPESSLKIVEAESFGHKRVKRGDLWQD